MARAGGEAGTVGATLYTFKIHKIIICRQERDIKLAQGDFVTLDDSNEWWRGSSQRVGGMWPAQEQEISCMCCTYR